MRLRRRRRQAGDFRFAVVNLADRTYELRDGSGIGVLAPQYGGRRGIFAGLAQ